MPLASDVEHFTKSILTNSSAYVMHNVSMKQISLLNLPNAIIDKRGKGLAADWQRMNFPLN